MAAILFYTITHETKVSNTTLASGIAGQPGSCPSERIRSDSGSRIIAIRQWNGSSDRGNLCLVKK